jgi:transcriptional regulator with XRE-family HTH domain
MTEPFAVPPACTPTTVYPVNATAAEPAETPDQRLMRLYGTDGGPLIGWLLDECQRRGQRQCDMAAELGVTPSYLHQLRSGVRHTAHISQALTRTCAAYLGVPPVIVKVLAGQLPMSDFSWPCESEEQVVHRALERMKQDPVARTLLPAEPTALPMSAKRALVLMYAESSRQEVIGVRVLPSILQWLQRAAVMHDEHEARALHAA